jgi:cytochrome c oxidase cbb3-type subunit 3
MARGAAVAIAIVSLAGCERESRPFRDLPVAASRGQNAPETTLSAGAAAPKPVGTSPYQENAWGLSEGKRLYSYYNCSGCHAQGGGAIGPALMDDEWIYGFEPAAIYETISGGRPNGMPAFGSKVPDSQIWQLVAYVQSMSGQTPIDAAPGRSDHMAARPPELATPYQGRTQTGHR